MPNVKKIPDETYLRRLHEAHGGNVLKISKAVNRPYSTVKSWMDRVNLPGKGKGGPVSGALSKETLEALYEKHGGIFADMARELGRPSSTVAKWCREAGIESKYREDSIKFYEPVYPQEIPLKVSDGYVVCFSDAHFWFKEKSRSHEALLVALDRLKPVVVVANGDVLDGATISRHDPSGIDPLPKLADELERSKEHMAEVARHSPKASRIFTLGNHDSRFSRFLAKRAPELEGVDGARLDHHILGWQFCMSCTVNDDVVIKHAFRGGLHATFNNTLHDGRTIVTGHLHAQMVRPFTDARGTRYGVDLGTLADPSWPQFSYTTANTKNWREGFGVLEFQKGKLLPPMLASVVGNNVYLQRNERLI